MNVAQTQDAAGVDLFPKRNGFGSLLVMCRGFCNPKREVSASNYERSFVAKRPVVAESDSSYADTKSMEASDHNSDIDVEQEPNETGCKTDSNAGRIFSPGSGDAGVIGDEVTIESSLKPDSPMRKIFAQSVEEDVSQMIVTATAAPETAPEKQIAEEITAKSIPVKKYDEEKEESVAPMVGENESEPTHAPEVGDKHYIVSGADSGTSETAPTERTYDIKDPTPVESVEMLATEAAPIKEEAPTKEETPTKEEAPITCNVEAESGMPSIGDVASELASQPVLLFILALGLFKFGMNLVKALITLGLLTFGMQLGMSPEQQDSVATKSAVPVEVHEHLQVTTETKDLIQTLENAFEARPEVHAETIEQWKIRMRVRSPLDSDSCVEDGLPAVESAGEQN